VRTQRPHDQIDNREGEILDSGEIPNSGVLLDSSEALAEDEETLQRADSSKPEELPPLFEAENARDYRVRWDIVQRGFVDDPAKAVREGDELVSEVIDTLSRTFAQARSTVETELSRQQNQSATEVLRCALRRDRAFFERLLSV
jgi:hypothetical protein